MNRHRRARCEGSQFCPFGGCDGFCREMFLAQEVMPAPDGADFGMSRGMVRTLTLVNRETFAANRARMLGQLMARPRECGSAWARLRAVLEARGLIRPRRASGAASAASGIVTCCPHTGPPLTAGVAGGLLARTRRGP